MSNNQQPNSILNRLLNDMDEEQIQRHPLQPHGIVGLKEDEKRLYATFLATLLIDQPISTSQSRLLMMLLDSMKLSIQLPDLYVSVAEVDKTKLQAFLKLADEKALSPVFLMDALVLCRLDKSLTENQAKSLAEFVSLLSVDDAMLVDIVHLSNKVLSYQENNENAVAEAIKDKTSLTIDFDYELLKHWHEFSYQVLTSDLLNKKLTGGSWIVTSLLELSKGLDIEKSILYFSNTAKVKLNKGSLIIKEAYLNGCLIESQATDIIYSINYEKSVFTNSNFTFNHHASQLNALIENCIFDNLAKLLKSQQPVLKFKFDSGHNKGIIEISGSEFFSNEYYGIYNENKSGESDFKIENCQFTGNAIQTGNRIGLKCINTQFKEFESNAFQIYKINESSDNFNLDFIQCSFEGKHPLETKNWTKIDKVAKAISMNNLELAKDWKEGANHLCIENSRFNNCAIQFKFNHYWCIAYPEYEPLENCNLENSPVFCNSEQEDKIFSNCDFKNSGNSNVVLMEN